MIGRFYHGRDHSTVVHGIQRIEALRHRDPQVAALLTEWKDQLTRRHDERDYTKIENTGNEVRNASSVSLDELAETIADRVWERIEERLRK